VVGVSLMDDVPSVKVKTERLSDEPAPVMAHHEAAEAAPGITPEIVAVIEAAAAAFVGKPVRILSIRALGDADGDSNAWAAQGRDIIQTSHNLVQRGH